MSMPPPRVLPRGKSSSSLNSEGKKKPLKQFTAGGIKAHNRNSSYGLSIKLNKLARISSQESIEDTEIRPLMSRSKSSDGVILKRNRSKTKLHGLQPLTRTISSQSYKGSKHKSSQVTFNSGGSDSEEEVDDFEDDTAVVSKAPGPSNEGPMQRHLQTSPSPAPHQPQQRPMPQNTIENSIPKYFGNILSQSTGMERTMVPNESIVNGSNYQEERPELANVSRYPSRNLNQIPESESDSYVTMERRGTRDESMGSYSSSNLIFQPSSTNIARQYNQQVSQEPYAERAGHLDTNGSSTSVAADFSRNFRDFLDKTPEAETRTQFKLWLQRENSILDLGQANKNYYINNAQFRTEFEKFAREYLNVRRNVNPVLGSLKRLEILDKSIIKPHTAGGHDLTSFDKFSPGLIDRIRENHVQLNKIWELGWKDHNTSSTSLNNLTNNVQMTSIQQRPQPLQQRPRPQQRNSGHMPLSQLPMTRAVAKNGGASIY